MLFNLISAQIILPSIAVLISFFGFMLNLYIVNRSGVRDRQHDFDSKADKIELEELEQKISEKADKIDLEKVEKRIIVKIEKSETRANEKMRMQYEFMTNKQEETLSVMENMQDQIQTIYKKLIPDA